MNNNKYTYLKIIQGLYDDLIGWEDLSAYEVKSDYRFKSNQERNVYMEDLKAYKTEDNQAKAIRTVKRRELCK